MKWLLPLALVCTALPLTAQTASPWNGTWKLDRAKSHLTGNTYTLSKDADAKWTESFGTLAIKFAPDGKPYPVFDQDHTISVTMPDAHTQKMVTQSKGKTTSVSTAILSADGKSLAVTEVDTRPDGTTYKSSETDKRIGPGDGFIGTWSSEKVASSGNSPTTITLAGKNLTLAIPAENYTLTVKLDGSPAKPDSPDVPAGMTVSYKQPSPKRLEWTAALNGKVVQRGYNQMAADGKSYTKNSWFIGSEKEKTVFYYVKQ